MSGPTHLPNESLVLAITAFVDPRTVSRITATLRSEGRAGLQSRFASLSESEKAEILEQAAEMSRKDIDAVLLGDPLYPAQLGPLSSTSPILFYWGNKDLLHAPSIGMCGSRHASDLGLKAARACGEEAGEKGVVVVSGYAKGVDTETHLAALRSGGKTIIVLAEGFTRFRIKQSFPRDLFRRESVLILSQFPPKQQWTAGGAMTRNKVIYGLGMALVVIEAGATGGTIAAGEGALDAGRPVIVLDFNGSTPAGNEALRSKGGISVATRTRLGEEIARLLDQEEQQLSLM